MAPGHWGEVVPIHQQWDPEEEDRSVFFHACGIFPPDFFFFAVSVILVCFLLLYKHQDQKQLGEERVCLTHTSSLSLREARTGTETGAIWDVAYWLAQVLLPFLYFSGPLAQGWCLLQGAGPFHVNQHQEDVPTDMPTGLSKGGIP